MGAHLRGAALCRSDAAQRIGERHAALAHEAQKGRALFGGHLAGAGAHL